MSIFAPQNVMGPAHRGNVIQQLAQGAAQNVMRRQKLKALLMHTAGQAGGSHLVGGGQPFRASTQGHATGVRGAVQRPLQAAGGVGVGMAAPQQGFANQADPLSLPDPGTPDLPSLPDATDPAQSPSSTQPAPVTDPNAVSPDGGSFSYANVGATPGPVGLNPPGTINSSMTGDTAAADATPIGLVSTANGTFQQQQLIPLGGGRFYDPVTDSIHGGR